MDYDIDLFGTQAKQPTGLDDLDSVLAYDAEARRLTQELLVGKSPAAKSRGI